MSNKEKKELAFRYVHFAASSLAGTVVDMLVLWIFSHYILSDNYWDMYWISPLISFECAVFTNFCLAYWRVWKDRIIHRTKIRFLRQFIEYNLSCVLAFVVKMGILLSLEHFFGWDVVWCNLVALLFSGILNFTLNEMVIFKKQSNPPSA